MTSPVQCRLDLYPASLTLTREEDGLTEAYQDVRVIITADRIYGFRDGTGGEGPVEFMNERLASIDGRNSTGYTVTLADDRVAFMRRSTGCGCGSRLRGFRPFPQGLVQGPWELS